MADGLTMSPSEQLQQGQNGYSRDALQSAETVYQTLLKNEKLLTDEKKGLAEAFYKYSTTLEKAIQNLRRRDMSDLNDFKEQLEKRFQKQVAAGEMSRQELGKKVARELNKFAYSLDSKRRVDEHAQDLQMKKSRLAIKQQELEEMKKLDKEYRTSEYSATLKQLNQLKEKRKQLAAAGKSTDSVDKQIKTLEKRAGKQKQDIQDANPAGARLGVQEELKGVAKALGGGAKGSLTDIKDFLEGNLSKEALEEAADSGDAQAAATLENIKRLQDNLNNLVNGIKELLNSYITEYSSYQAKVNARLQGSGQTWNLGGIGDSLKNAVGTNPYIKLSKLLENASVAVEKGIAYNIEQRAFLETISSSIAETFDAFDASLLRLIRLQQNDSTAARLGLEASLTQLFNSYFSDSSYLSDAFDSVSQSLTDAIAQMGTEEGLSFEYIVQKWLGSLYSVGFSDSSISNIANALDMLGSGDVSGLASNSAMQNLIVMAASRAGLSYADMLTEGLDADTTNTLLKSMVEYLQEIAESDNKVIKSQYAQIFGLTASDLKAVENLGSTIESLSKDTLDYAGAVDELYYQVNQLPSRLSVGEMTGNLIDNVKYALASGIADNPITYALWEMTDMIEGLSGGIQLPTVSMMGNSFSLNTSLTNLARLGIAGASLLGNIGTIASGVSSTLLPSSMLAKLGITSSSNNTITRGNGLGRREALRNQVSASNLVGNSAGEDYEASLTAQAQAEEDAVVEAKQQEEQTKTVNDIHEYLLQVFDPKITAMAQMLGNLSGTTVLEATNKWGNFQTSQGTGYSATTISISNIGEASMASQNAENIKNIRSDVNSILELLRSGQLRVIETLASSSSGSIPNPATGGNTNTW